MKKIKLTFERGGQLFVTLNDPQGETARCILAALPRKSELTHSRYCGREVCFALDTTSPPPKENQQICVNKFDVGYWRNWDSPNRTGLPGSPGAETMSFYYGKEKLLFKGEPISVNVFGHITPDQEAMLDEIGHRIWTQGFEGIYAEVVDC